MPSNTAKPDQSFPFKQGSVVYFNFGPPAEDRRDEGLMKESHYAVVAQMTAFSSSPNIALLMVCAMTSTEPKNRVGWVEVTATEQNGLEHTSWLNAKVVYPIRKDQVERYVGQLEYEKVQVMKQILAQLYDVDREHLPKNKR